MGSERGRSAWLLVLAAVVWALAGLTLVWLRRVAPGAVGFDFYVYLRAFRVAATEGNPYLPYHIGEGFLNHPALLTAVSPLAGLPAPAAQALWLVFSAAAWLVACRFGAAVIDVAPGRRYWLLVLLGFAPAVEMLYVGQVNAFALLAMLLAYGLSERGRPLPAGLLLAVAIVLKTTPVFLLLYFVAVRQWRVIAAAVAGLAVLTLLPAIQFGPFILSAYVQTAARLSAEIHPQPLNLGLPALLDRGLRALGTDPAAWFVRGALRLVVAGVALSLLLPAVVRRPREAQRFALFATFAALGTLASPLIWYHHLIFLLPALAAVLASRSGRWHALGIACLLAVQSERVWETAVIGFPLPAAVGMVALTAAAAWRSVAVGEAQASGPASSRG